MIFKELGNFISSSLELIYLFRTSPFSAEFQFVSGALISTVTKTCMERPICPPMTVMVS